MITSLLVANRGEIACRIMRTARKLGIRTVAVYSDADAKALHVRSADEAVHIGASPARESYLVGDKIIAAAKRTGAEAIHPGYGFLSENADFAQAVLDAGLIWVGPAPASIRAMGLKDAAKALMDAAGVPTTPGYLGADQSPERLATEADAIGYPVLIKAVAGGGGKGMRLVEAADAFADALTSCRREAASSFGNDHVLIEKYIQRPRHIEVQVFGDAHGNIVHLFERDCSLQRRHQKVIEEAPAPGMDEATRAAICDAAVKAARAVDYVGAGTIEFIADASEGLRADRIWFMEMNTRLQVEHPVTEEITGVDLVEWQLRVASGEKLPKRQQELSISGHAIEARLYAEDPSKGFLPSIGRLELFQLDDFQGDLGLRYETGVEQGDEITPFYDPMIAKVIAYSRMSGVSDADDRASAAGTLALACRMLVVWPVKTNAAFLAAALDEEVFRKGDVTTSFLAEHEEALTQSPSISDRAIAHAAFLLTDLSAAPARHDVHSHVVTPPPQLFSDDRAGRPTLSGFRLNRPRKLTVRVSVGSEVREVEPERHRGQDDYRRIAQRVVVTHAGFSQLVAFEEPRGTGGGGTASDGAIISPMPGRVIAVEVAAGAAVTKGQKLVTLEAMKMEHSLVAPFDGTVAEMNAVAGAQVGEGALLARIDVNPD